MNVVDICVSRDPGLYAKCIADNRHVACFAHVKIDNSSKNDPIPVCYNRFLDAYDYSKEAWFVFCHEDFEFQEDVGTLLEHLGRDSLHGVVGAARRGFAGFGMQVIYGNMTEVNRDGIGKEWTPGRKIAYPIEVEAFDCCCLIVHSSLVAKHGLRFDENLFFDLYVEDFCASAKVKHGIRSYVHPVKCCHHSGSRATDRLLRHLPYLKKKYPRHCFVGTLAYFGTPSWQKTLQDRVVSAMRSVGRPEVSIVLLTWNRSWMLETCLREMFASFADGVSREIILMDNASDDATPEVLKRYSTIPGVKVLRNKKNLRLNAYKKLFGMARGRIVIEVDDDVLKFPKNFDKTFLDYFSAYPDYGYLALNVVQDGKTNGAKPDASHYKDDVRGDKVVEEGPVGGWCAAFYRWHYRLVSPLLWFSGFSMARGEDGFLMGIAKKVFRKRHGIIKNAVCLHATSPEYAREFGLLKREREKYTVADMTKMAEAYK